MKLIDIFEIWNFTDGFSDGFITIQFYDKRGRGILSFASPSEIGQFFQEKVVKIKTVINNEHLEIRIYIDTDQSEEELVK